MIQLLLSPALGGLAKVLFFADVFYCLPIFFLQLSGKGRGGALDSRRFAEGEQPDLKQGDQGDAEQDHHGGAG